MALERYLNLRSFSLLTLAALGGSYAGFQYRKAQEEKRNANTYHVKTERSGGGV